MAKKTDTDVVEDNDAIEDIADDLADARERAESWLEEQVVLARERTRAEPVKMMAIAAGVGALIGAFFLRL